MAECETASERSAAAAGQARAVNFVVRVPRRSLAKQLMERIQTTPIAPRIAPATWSLDLPAEEGSATLTCTLVVRRDPQAIAEVRQAIDSLAWDFNGHCTEIRAD